MGIVDDIGGWTGRLKRVYDVAKDAQNVELTETISDLRIALSGWKVKFAEMEEETLALKAKIKDLEQKLSIGDELVFRDGVYYRAQTIEGKPNGPFCPACWEEHRRMSSLGINKPPFYTLFRFQCPRCQANIP